MNANWWALQKIIEFRQVEIAKAARLRSIVADEARGRPLHSRLRPSVDRLKHRAGRLFLRWGSRLCAGQDQGAVECNPLHA